MATLANLDTGEITDKGYVNQRKVLHARSSFVDLVLRRATPSRRHHNAKDPTMKFTDAAIPAGMVWELALRQVAGIARRNVQS